LTHCVIDPTVESKEAIMGFDLELALLLPPALALVAALVLRVLLRTGRRLRESRTES
jgi:hypothetical protein